jgi:hypothetical protein
MKRRVFMKRMVFLGLLIFCPCLSIVCQDRFVKDPNEIGACINTTSKLASVNTGPIVNGGVTIWRLDEVLLVAKVVEQRVNGRKTRVRQGWAIVDNNGQPVPFSEATRTRPRGGKTFFQRLVYTRSTNPEGCFVVEQKEV